MKQAHQANSSLAIAIVDQLMNLGVTDFCIGSGSRSTPFADALRNRPSASTHVSYEERSLGFFALGIAKASNTPVVVITTTGSALANTFPAVMEAYHSNTTLIVISCDRPFENRARGLNQTCDQENFFQKYCCYHINIPSTLHNYSKASISSYLNYGVNTAKTNSLPIHLNVSFDEPLIDASERSEKPAQPTSIYHSCTSTLDHSSVDFFTDLFSSKEKGIIIAGEIADKDASIEIIRLAEKLGYPILADPLSGLRELGRCSICITHYNGLIQHGKCLEDLQPEVVIFLGKNFVSKNIFLWAQSLQTAHQVLVNSFSSHFDPTLSISTFVKMQETIFCKQLNEHLQKRAPNDYFSLWKQYSLTMDQQIETFFDAQETLYEPIAVSSLTNLITKNVCNLFLGNSLSIRYGDNFFFPKQPTGKIYGNRGVSGIDGNISTALGITAKTNAPLVCVIGDKTFAYDVNALSIMANKKIPLILVVLNNECGSIFDFLPYSKDRDLVENFVSPNESIDIGKIATSYGISFWKTSEVSDYEKMVEHLMLEGNGGIIEVQSSRKSNLAFHESLQKMLSKTTFTTTHKEKNSFFSLKKKAPSQKLYVSTDF